MNNITSTPSVKAYSYRRFSSQSQAAGDSLRRQTEAAQTFANQHGLELDQQLTFEDLGVSAFRGKNRTEGALAAFMSAVDSGLVEQGSYLLIENLDRLSREQVTKAFSMFTDILHKGIVVATLIDGRVYTKETIDSSVADLMISLMTLYRANEESEVKSQRLRAAWKAKRDSASGVKMTKWCPQWLRLSEDRTEFRIIEEKAAIVRRIFDLYLSGLGKMAIASQFNLEDIPPIGRSSGWHHSYITKILANAAVIGQFQPQTTEVVNGKRKNHPAGEPIEDYYPAIVTKAVFYKAQRQREQRSLPRGRRGSDFANLFRGLAKCAVCGGSMNYGSKGKRWATSKKPNVYLQCANARRKMANCNHTAMWPYSPVEYFLTEGIGDINFMRLFPEITSAGMEEVAKITEKIEEAEGELKDTSRSISNIVDALQDRPSSSSLLSRLDELEARESTLGDQLAKLRQDAEGLTTRLQTVQKRYDMQDDLIAKWRLHQNDPLLRSNLNRSMADTIELIEFFPMDEDSQRVIRITFKDTGKGRVWSLVIHPLEKRGEYFGLAVTFDDDPNEGDVGNGAKMLYPPEIEHKYDTLLL